MAMSAPGARSRKGERLELRIRTACGLEDQRATVRESRGFSRGPRALNPPEPVEGEQAERGEEIAADIPPKHRRALNILLLHGFEAQLEVGRRRAVFQGEETSAQELVRDRAGAAGGRASAAGLRVARGVYTTGR